MSQYAYALEQLESAISLFAKDLEALPEELVCNPYEKARAVCDFTYEIITIHDRYVARWAGNDPGAWPFEKWAEWPGRATKAEVIAKFKESGEAMINAFKEMGQECAETEYTLPNGTTSTPAKQVLFSWMHTMYHGGQLNYLQSLTGDMEVHWA